MLRGIIIAGLLSTMSWTSAQAETAPLSAIDWLSQSVTVPAATGTQPPKPPLDEPPVADSASTPTITVTPLDAPSPDPIGLLPPEVTGLPRGLWAASDQDTVVALVQAGQPDALPAIQEFLTTLMLAEADPPLGAGVDGALFLARVDKLLDFGAIEQAQALLEQADPEEPELFRRWFDVALLTGSEDRACDVMQSNPQLAPTFSARIFCLARSGDWNTAALTLNTHRVLGDMTAEEEELLTRFLDPELFEDEANLPVPSRISPLVFRMREAIGEALPTPSLPRAFAHADLRNTVGWKSQMEAAERLARHGAVEDNVLLGFYTARPQSASGGVWDRVEAIQRFDTAVTSRDPGAVSNALPGAWTAAKAARIEPAFARLYADVLGDLPLSGDATELGLTIGLLSNDYEEFALAAPGTADPFQIAVARGFAEEADATGAIETAIKAGFGDTQPPAALTTLVADGKLGEALLRNVALFNAGVSGDTRAISESLSLFRAVGLEDVARRAALQLLLLDRLT